MLKKIQSALISVYHKDNLERIVELLQQNNVTIYSTGGTQTFIEGLGAKVIAVETLTDYPSIFGGRVKTLHPFVHMGLLARPELPDHDQTMKDHQVKYFDLVVGNLYPFEKTALDSNSSFEILIENIDIGGPSFLRSSAKNYKNVLNL